VVLNGGHDSRSQVFCVVFVDGRFSICPLPQNMRIKRTCHPWSFLLLLKTILSQISILTINVHVVSILTQSVLENSMDDKFVLSSYFEASRETLL
jgi:hypothetical protein